MHPKNEGLTVGELCITIAAIIIVFLIWSSFSKNEEEKKTSLSSFSTYSLNVISKTI